MADASLLQRAGVKLDDPSGDAATRVAQQKALRYAPKERSALGLGLIAIVAVVLAFFALWVASGSYGTVAHAQGAVTLRESILSAADQCYAVEGAYPPTLDYLEKHYALAINREGYDVLYDAFASNIAPTVVVRAR